MATYDYLCTDCLATTEVTATIAEKQAGLAPRCDACGGTALRRTFTAVAVLGRPVASHAGGCGCAGGGCACGA